MSEGSDNDDNDNGELDGSDSDEGSVDVPNSRESSPPSPPPVSNKSRGQKKNGSQSSSVLDFSRPPLSSPPSMISPLAHKKQSSGHGGRVAGDSPLDLSVSHKKSPKEDDNGPLRKLPKWSPSLDHQPMGRSERKSSWNGTTHSPDIKALEKMSEMSPGGKMSSPRNSSSSSSTSSWQAQWLAQNSTGTREIFKCVVCRATFNTLAALSVHMKESKHGPPMPNLPSPNVKLPNNQQSPVHPTTPTGGSSSTSNDSLLLKGMGVSNKGKYYHACIH